MHFLFQGTGYLENFTADNIEVEKFKTGNNFQIIYIPKESYGSFKSYGCLMISFKFIHCFLPKQLKRFFFTCNLLFIHNDMERVIHSQLAKIRLSSVKIWRI